MRMIWNATLMAAASVAGSMISGCSSSSFSPVPHAEGAARESSSAGSGAAHASAVHSDAGGGNCPGANCDAAERAGISTDTTVTGTATPSVVSVNGSDGFPQIGSTSSNAGTGDADASSTSSFRFGLLVNDLRCAMCHLTVNGDVVSTQPVTTWSLDAAVTMLSDHSTPNLVNGQWLAAVTYSTKAISDAGVLMATEMPITVAGSIQQNYRGVQVPTLDGVPQFPTLDMDAVQQSVSGTLAGASLTGDSAIEVAKVYDGNLAITGDKDHPIQINGDVFVSGDLVIDGYYQGVGTIYVAGRIYIPADLRAVTSVFPYPTDRSQAEAKAQEYVASQQGDALALASANSIFIADLDSGLYDDPGFTPPRIPADARRATAGVDEVYSWFPGGKAGYANLYKPSVSCTDGSQVQNRSFNLIEAFLYSAHTIGGISRQGSWAINGGVIANSLHIIGRAGRAINEPDNNFCTAGTVSPVHGLPMNSNYVNYDYRLGAGLRLLSKLSAFYQH